MKRFIPLALLVVMCAHSCGQAPKVAQGTVMSYDANTKIMLLQEESSPQPVLTISLASADYGREPASGDTVRISYREENGQLMAVRIMNLSQQTELKKKGH